MKLEHPFSDLFTSKFIVFQSKDPFHLKNKCYYYELEFG